MSNIVKIVVVAIEPQQTEEGDSSFYLVTGLPLEKAMSIGHPLDECSEDYMYFKVWDDTIFGAFGEFMGKENVWVCDLDDFTAVDTYVSYPFKNEMIRHTRYDMKTDRRVYNFDLIEPIPVREDHDDEDPFEQARDIPISLDPADYDRYEDMPY